MDEINMQTDTFARPAPVYPSDGSQLLFEVIPGWREDFVSEIADFAWIWRIGQRLPFIPLEPSPLSIDEAVKIVNKYLAGVKNSDLIVDVVFTFENNTLARVIEKNTGIGAFDVMIDPWTWMVYPVPGPTIIWNQKYDLSSGSDGVALKAKYVRSKMALTPVQAIRKAQTYLDENQAGSITNRKPYPYYGFYSLEVIQDQMVIGRLDVNGETGEVYPQLNHGALIETNQ